jgi:Urb2/Npa2 family
MTTADVFHDIVAIINAMVRLRRDLVVLMLPHLGMVLRQLVMSIRGLRPQLGAKQTRLVADTFPRWVNPAHPLGADEAKALARLLETLTTKSIIKSHAAFTDTQKAESLARPFSKHAAFVLNAYLDIMSDPLCIVPLELRKALQPGLFALCDMLNEHGRDALMVSISDASGRATMKSLWKEYEKQRYVGKG